MEYFPNVKVLLFRPKYSIELSTNKKSLIMKWKIGL